MAIFSATKPAEMNPFYIGADMAVPSFVPPLNKNQSIFVAPRLGCSENG
jgi:hypothetical protein